MTFRLSVDIDSNDLDTLTHIQQELSLALSRLGQVTRYSFDRIEDLGETERRNRSIRETMSGVAAPPDSMGEGLTDRQQAELLGMIDNMQDTYTERLRRELELDEIKEDLKEYIENWKDYKDQTNGDFIDEEEMNIE